jgi:putative nucleotidyltransferase with HDIG domain
MKKVSLQEIVEKVDQLPEMPQVALRVSRLMEDPDTNAQHLAEIIRLDPNLTGQVLRICNSAAYGFSRKIGTVREAIAILGFNTLKSMVYTIISHGALNRPIRGYALEKGALWHNALTCAVYAKHLAEQYRYVDPELAFTGALLRDIGKIVIGEFVGANYNEIEELAYREKIDFVEAEERVLGLSHTDVGMKVAEKWNLPDKLVKVIQHHHRPSLMPEDSNLSDVNLTTVIHLADAFTLLIGTGVGSDGLMYFLDIKALQNLGIDIEGPDLERILSDLVDLHTVIQDFSEAF